MLRNYIYLIENTILLFQFYDISVFYIDIYILHNKTPVKLN